MLTFRALKDRLWFHELSSCFVALLEETQGRLVQLEAGKGAIHLPLQLALISGQVQKLVHTPVVDEAVEISGALFHRLNSPHEFVLSLLIRPVTVSLAHTIPRLNHRSCRCHGMR